LLLPANDAGASDAGDDAALDAGGSNDAGPTCARTVPPDRPTTEDGTENVDFVVAAARVRIFPGGSASFPHPTAPVGFDLDDTCTCPGPPSCRAIGAQQQCDGEGGTDDGAGVLFERFALLAPGSFSDDALNAPSSNGLGTLLMRVRGYNGGQNDKQVIVTVYVSSGIQGIQYQEGGALTPPKNDGTDVWTVDPSSLLGGATVDGGASCEGNDNVCVPLFVDTEGYVTNGVLVARIDFPIAVGAGSSRLVMKISGGVTTAPLIRNDGGTYRVDDGQLAGRWNTADVLTAISNIQDPLAVGHNLCLDSGTYANIKELACKASDITTQPAMDNMGLPCDALSIAIGLSAVPAHLGPIYARPITPAPCGPDWKDDCSAVH
jgi:hypothetical protein